MVSTLADRLAGCAWEDTPSTLRLWQRDGALQRSLVAEAEDAVANLNDLRRAEEFRAAIPVPGTTPADYLPRHVELPGVGHALIGLRFMAGHPDQAFVQLEGATRPVAPCLDALAAVAQRSFCPFRPRWLRVETGDRDLFSARVQRGDTPDLVTVAGITSELLGRSPPWSSSLTVRRLDTMADFGRYRDEYARVLSERPGIRAHVEPEERETLNALGRAGGLFEIRADEKAAGVVAFRYQPMAGRPGYRVVEMVLYAPFRLRGLAAPAQRLAIEARSGDDGDSIIFGSIHAANIPALRTACRVGRVPVRWSFLIALDAEP